MKCHVDKTTYKQPCINCYKTFKKFRMEMIRVHVPMFSKAANLPTLSLSFSTVFESHRDPAGPVGVGLSWSWIGALVGTGPGPSASNTDALSAL